MYCSKCGKKVADSENTCPKCGSDKFSAERRGAKFSVLANIWILVSLVANMAMGVYYLMMGINGTNPNIKFILEPPFLSFEISVMNGLNFPLFLIGLLIAVYSLVYIILLVLKKQFLYGVLMVSAISIASFMFFFYGGSVLSIIMIPVLVVFPALTRAFIGNEWDYMS